MYLSTNKKHNFNNICDGELILLYLVCNPSLIVLKLINIYILQFALRNMMPENRVIPNLNNMILVYEIYIN